MLFVVVVNLILFLVVFDVVLNRIFVFCKNFFVVCFWLNFLVVVELFIDKFFEKVVKKVLFNYKF